MPALSRPSLTPQEIIAGKKLRMVGIVGIYAANSVGDDIEVYSDETRAEVGASGRGRTVKIEAAQQSASCAPCVAAPPDCVPALHTRTSPAGPALAQVAARFHGLRQQAEKDAGEPYFCVSDFIAPRSTGMVDYLGMFANAGGCPPASPSGNRSGKACFAWWGLCLPCAVVCLHSATAETVHPVK